MDSRISGPVNATAPQPARNDEWSKTLAKILRSPAMLPVPTSALRLLLGSQGADEFTAANQRVIPATLNGLGHEFARPKLDDALRHELGHHRNIRGVVDPTFSAESQGSKKPPPHICIRGLTQP